MGGLQALEAIKMVLEVGDSLSGRLMLWDGLRATFRVAKLRAAREGCMCGQERSQLLQHLEVARQEDEEGRDEPLTCDRSTPAHELEVEVEALASLQQEKKVVLVDVRPASHFQMCQLPDSINVPLAQLSVDTLPTEAASACVVFVCRRGRDSLEAACRMQGLVPHVLSLRGGLQQYARTVDPSFPIY